MHLAAESHVDRSIDGPMGFIETNIVGTYQLLQHALEYWRNLDKVAKDNFRFHHISTDEVYGSLDEAGYFTEETPYDPRSPYSASKIAADQLVYAYYSSFDLPVTTIRPFNTYGPRQSQRAVIPAIISQLISGNNIIELGALTPTRDFNFVDDTVLGYIKALSAENISGTTINLGSGFEISIGETVKLIAKIMNQDVEVVSSDARMRPKNSEVDRLLGIGDENNFHIFLFELYLLIN